MRISQKESKKPPQNKQDLTYDTQNQSNNAIIGLDKRRIWLDSQGTLAQLILN